MRKSIFHTKLITLNKRLITPRPDIKEELARCEAGFEGERRLLYYLSETKGAVRILHDIRLPFPSGYTYFQMDTVVITQQMIMIIDAKHFHGHLIFDRVTRQLRRGNVTYEDPITQVNRHKRGLEQWLDRPIPIEAVVAFTHPHIRIEITPPDAFEQSLILYAPELPAKIDECHKGKKVLFTKQEVHEMADKLKRHHQPHDPDILSRFSVLPEHIQAGIQCEKCQGWQVKRVKRSWICPVCRKVLKQPHLSALKEYVHLFGPEATNREIRTFTGIQSESVVKRLLGKWAVAKEGEAKGRVYRLPEEWKRE